MAPRVRAAASPDFSIKLREKQKLRFNYGVSERQLRRLVLDARKSNEPTGDVLLQLLERRLDNVVFRSGFAPTIMAARQLVSHRHVRVNGQTINIPSVRLKVGDEVTIKAKSIDLPIVMGALQEPPLSRPEWLAWDEEKKTGKVSASLPPKKCPSRSTCSRWSSTTPTVCSSRHADRLRSASSSCRKPWPSPWLSFFRHTFTHTTGGNEPA